MSRIKIFSVLFLSLVIGATASFFLYQQWLMSYQETVLKPTLQRDWRASQAVLELFAFQKMQAATRHVLGSPRLLEAFRQTDPKKRHDSSYTELNVLKTKPALKEASLLAATDGKGMAFVNASTVNWTKNWQKLRPVEMALSGQASHGIAMFQEKPHIFVTIPVMGEGTGSGSTTTPPADRTQDDGQQDARRDPPPPRRSAKKKGQCEEGEEYHCPWTCPKWKSPKKGTKGKKKCIKWVRSKKCSCRKKKGKTGSLLRPFSSPLRYAQSAPDDRPAADAPKPADRPAAKSTGPVAVVVIGFAIGKGLADDIKKQVGTDIEFFYNQKDTFGGTLTGKERETLRGWIKGKSPESGAINARNSEKLFLASLSPTRDFAAVSGPLGRVKESGMLLLRPLSPSNRLFMQYNIQLFAVIGIAFLLALLLLLPGVTKFQQRLEEMEEKILDAYNTGKLDQSFNENAPWILGPFAATLNKFFRQLRGEPDEDDQRPLDAMDWSALAKDRATPAPPSVVVPPKATPLPPTQEQSMLADAEPEPEQEQEHEEAATASAPNEEGLSPDKINYYLENPEEHYEEVYTQYRDAKVQVGEDVTRLKKDKFIEKLRKNAESYLKKYDCKGVLFDVTVKDDKVILKPQLIPKE